MNTDCKYLESCALFQRFKNAQGKAIWISVFCKGEGQKDCVRLQMRERGEVVPETLLPSGTHLQDPR